MATEKTKNPIELVFEWEGKDRNGKQVRGEMRAGGENQVQASHCDARASCRRRSKNGA
jgi:type IV pilus assembly protein PilC